jgi:hypothetical protein
MNVIGFTGLVSIGHIAQHPWKITLKVGRMSYSTQEFVAEHGLNASMKPT